MELFLIVWLAFGAFHWIRLFFEFRKVRYLRPGLIDLLLLIIAGPLPYLHTFFE